MHEINESQLPYGVKEKENNKINSSVLKQLDQLDWLKALPDDPNIPRLPFPYGTREPIFKERN